MKTNINTAPYWDDFNEFKNFHEILFRPGYSVQARELTQLQSILKNQIAKFGNHIFKHGSVVIPGNSIAELNTPYITVAGTNPDSGATTDVTLFEGNTVIGMTTGIRAIVKKTVAKSGVIADTLYLSYLSGSGASGKTVFDIGEVIFIEGASTVKATVSTTGEGTLAHIGAGVYYIDGTFVSIDTQTCVVDQFSTVPSAHVLLKITESIITSNDDETLLDPAQGSYNFAAPGADRLKVELTLVALPLGTVFGEDYIEIMRYNQGVLEEHARYPKYNELEKSLARRTFDESGDYIVSGYNTTVRENLRTVGNNGVYPNGDASKLCYDISAGRGYINGFEVESLTTTRFTVDKGRSDAHVLNDTVTKSINYGQYLMAATMTGGFSIETNEKVYLYDLSAPTGGNLIGEAYIMAVDYYTGDPVTTPIYKLYLYNIKLSTKTIADIGSVRGGTATAVIVSEYDISVTSGSFATGNVVNYSSSTRAGTVAYYNGSKIYLHKHSSTISLPISGDTVIYSTTGNAILTSKTTLVSVGQSSMVFKLPNEATKSLKNNIGAGSFDLTETVYRTLTIAFGSTTSSITDGTILPLEVGNFIATTNAGTSLAVGLFTLNGSSNQITYSGTTPSGGITCYVQVRRSNKSPRTKTKTTITGETRTTGAFIQLAHTDVIAITSIVAGGIDVTNRYALNNGQTDYTYGFGSLRIRDGYTVPTAGTLTVNYTYFAHGTGASMGDFFTADSYTSLGSSYLDLIPTYISPVDGAQYKLRDCIDYRHNDDITVANGNTVVIDSFLTTSVKRFIPRTDIIVLDKSGEVSVITGLPSVNAVAPSVPLGSHLLQTIKVPAYTDNLTDIISTRVATIRSTMKDIKNISDRIARVEDYSTLSALENQSVQSTVIDAKTGLNKFKTGYLTEDMTDPLLIADALNAQFRAGWNSGGLTAAREVISVNLNLIEPTVTSTLYNNLNGTPAVVMTSSGYAVHNNGVLTLNYTEEVFASQPVSSRVTNINPFALVAWTGSLQLYPNGDTWIDQVDRPEIFDSVSTTSVAYNYIMGPEPAPVPRPTTVDIAFNNSLVTAGATGQFIVHAPLEAVHDTGGGIYVLNPNVTEADARAWVSNQIAAGLTVPRQPGQPVNILGTADR